MSAERLGDSISAVNHEGDVISVYDLEEFESEDIRKYDEAIADSIISDIEIHLPYSIDTVSQLGQNALNQAQETPTIEESIRSHPSSQNENDTKISELTKNLIDEHRLLASELRQHKRSPKVPIKGLMKAVIKHWDEMSVEDRRAVAVEAGLAPDAFEKKDDSTPPKKRSSSDRPRYSDPAMAAANDHNDHDD